MINVSGHRMGTAEVESALVAHAKVAEAAVVGYPHAPGLPKTRSGKIMRRILRKIAENDYGALGDTSTLAEPAVVDDLIENRMNRS